MASDLVNPTMAPFVAPYSTILDEPRNATVELELIILHQVSANGAGKKKK